MLGAAVVLLSVSAVPAQYTWVQAGTPPAAAWAGSSFGPFAVAHAFWDETRGRARVTLVSVLGGGTASLHIVDEFDGANWIEAGNPPGSGYPMWRSFDAVCADPRGAGRHVLFGGLSYPVATNDTYVWDPIGRAWATVSPATRPAGRFLHSMALLPGVGAVMVGGQFGLTGPVTDETWIWNGSDWHQVLTSPRPSARTTPALAFDPVRGELLLLGDGGAANDTWSFDGTRWLQLSPANSPGGGGLRQMVTDPIRQTVLLFGGTTRYFGSPAPRNDTWTWNGTNWNQRAPAHVPPPRIGATVVWDSQSQRVLLLSGYDDGAIRSLTDSWAWDGTDWTELRSTDRAQPVVPSARSSPFLAHIPQTHRTILFGGYTRQSIFDVPLADTWESDARLWQRRMPPSSPPASFQGAGAILRSTGELYWLPGKDVFGSSYNQSWNWGGQQWSALSLSAAPIPSLAHQVVGSLQSSQLGWVLVRLVTSGTAPVLTNTLQLISPFSGVVQPMFPGSGPTPRLGSVMVQSNSPTVVSNGVWLFGGATPLINGSTYHSELWSLTDTGVGGNLSWTRLWPGGPQGPSPRVQPAAAHHPGLNGICVMGGQSSSLAALGDTWFFNFSSNSWTQVAVPGPPPRYAAAMTYDADLNRLVLTGGYDGTTFFDDIWEFDGTAWMQRTTPGKPPPRGNATLVQDRTNGRSLLFGGYNGSVMGDLWSYDGSAWSPLLGIGPARPAPRCTHTACFDEAHGMMVVFGGTNDGSTSLADTWRFDATGHWTPGALGPPRRLNAAMTYAVLQGIPCTVLFGGWNQGAFLGDAFRYDLSTDSWQPLAAGPPARDIHAMTWDRLRNVVVLFGGRDSSNAFLDDTWELNLATGAWSLRTPVHRPPGRWNHVLAFDESRARTVMTGGYAGAYLNDVWEWDGVDWLQRTPETGPPAPREDAAGAYDPARGRLRLFGGADGSAYRSDLWELHARIDTAGAGNTANREGLRFYSQPALGQPLRLGFQNAQGVGFATVGFGPLQLPIAPLPVPPLCEPSNIWASFSTSLVLGTAEPNLAWNVPNTPLIVGVTLVFQAFALQPQSCWRASDALHVRF